MWHEIPELSPSTTADGMRSRRTLLQLLVILVVVGVLWSVGLRSHAVVVGVVGTTLSIAVMRSARLAGVMVRIVNTVTQLMTTVVVATLHVFVFTPVGVYLRLRRRRPLGDSSPSSWTTWIERTRGDASDLESRQFSRDVRGSTARVRTGVGGLVRACVAVAVVAAVLNVAAGFVAQTLVETRTDARALASSPWWDEYAAELDSTSFRWHPLRGFKRQDFVGEYVNIRDGVRSSYQTTATFDAAPLRVHFFGGSTMFGTGQRDDFTIPSHVARLAEADGLPVRVTNHGQNGWVIWQSVAELELLLAAGEIPDIAVFYDGFNETLAQMNSPSPEPTFSQAQRVQQRLSGRTFRSILREAWAEYEEYSLVHLAAERLVRGQGGPARDPGELVRLEDQVVELHRGAVELVETLAEGYGFEVRFYWQPTALDHVGEGEPDATAAVGAGFVRVHRGATERLEPPVIDLTRVLDTDGGPFFYDVVHTNEAGAAVVAEAIYSDLESTMRAELG